MNQHTRGIIAGPVIAATVAVAVLISACSGAGRSSGGAPADSSSRSPSAVAYSACMRSHGVTRYPDPTAKGNLPKGGSEAFGVSAPTFRSAQHSCQSLLPATGDSIIQQYQQCVSAGVCPQALVQEALASQRVFARCMRAHGVPNFPDPKIDPNGAPYFPASEAGLSRALTHSADYRTKEEQCQSAAGGTVPIVMG